jgi:hypothetical protein
MCGQKNHQSQPNKESKKVGGSNEESNQNRSRIGLCRCRQWQSTQGHQPSPQGSISAHHGIEGIQLAQGDAYAE